MNTEKNSNGISFTGALQILFITLKLLKVIDWSWIWVLAPSWISIVLVIIIMIIFKLASKEEN